MCQPRVFSLVKGDYHLDGGGCLSSALGWSSSHHYVPVRNTPGQGSQRNNGPEQDQILITLCSLLSLWAKNGIRLCVCVGGGGGPQQTPYGGIRTLVFFFCFIRRIYSV